MKFNNIKDYLDYWYDFFENGEKILRQPSIMIIFGVTIKVMANMNQNLMYFLSPIWEMLKTNLLLL